MDMNTGIQFLVAINAGTLIAVVTYGYKIIRFITRIELKTDIMWADFVKRTGYVHKRRSD